MTHFSLLTALGSVVLCQAALGQTPDPFTDPPKIYPSFTGENGDPGNGAPFWIPSDAWGPEKNHESEPGYDYRWLLHLKVDHLPGWIDPQTQITYYGLAIQEVRTLAAASSCEEGEEPFMVDFTYYEYQWISDASGGGLSDAFGTGYWDMGPGEAEVGFIWKRGTLKFISALHPEAWSTYQTLLAEGGWNTAQNTPNETLVKDANGDPVECSPHKLGGKGGTLAHSGTMPNRHYPPAGWDTDFGGSADSIYRDYFLTWDYCSPSTDSDSDQTGGEGFESKLVPRTHGHSNNSEGRTNLGASANPARPGLRKWKHGAPINTATSDPLLFLQHKVPYEGWRSIGSWGFPTAAPLQFAMTQLLRH